MTISSYLRPPIRVISLDAGETLLHPHPSFGGVFLDACARAGLSLDPGVARALEIFAGEYSHAYRNQGKLFSRSVDESRGFWEGLYRAFLAKQGFATVLAESLPPGIYDRFTQSESYRLYDDSIEALEALRARGFRLGIVSNWEPWGELMFGQIGLTARVDFVVVSGIVGVEKPDPRIFAKAVELAQVEPGEILHVGDNIETDVAGARAVGMQAVLLDRGGYYPGEVARVGSLRELVGLLDATTARDQSI